MKINFHIFKFKLISPEDEQSILFETSRPQRLFSEPTDLSIEIYTWLYPQVYCNTSYFLKLKCFFAEKRLIFCQLQSCKNYEEYNKSPAHSELKSLVQLQCMT